MLFTKQSTLSWDKISTVCLANVHTILAFYISSAVLTDQTLLFGSAAEKNASLTYSSLIFTLGFWARPLGALLFGLQADLVCYSRAIKNSVSLVLIATALIGLLPATTLGVYILAVLRIAQGIGLGGSYAAMGAFLYRQSPVGAQGRTTAFFQGSVPLGYLIVLLLLLLYKTSVSENILAGNAWRILFFIPVLWLLLFRSFISVSPETSGQSFSAQAWHQYFDRGKLLLLKHWRTLAPHLLLVMALGILAFASVNLKFYLLKSILKVPAFTADISAAIATIFTLPFYYVGGYLADKGRIYRNNVILSLLMAFALPTVFRYVAGVTADPTISEYDLVPLFKVAGALTIVSSLLALFYGGLVKYICELFPRRFRGLMFGLSYSLSISIGGGLLNIYGTQTYLNTGNKYAGMDMTSVMTLIFIAMSILSKVFLSPRQSKLLS